MLAVERRKLILEKVHAEKKVIVSELSKEFEVSEETIRRDLDKLADEGHVIKSYGGAVINEIGSIDLPFNVRWKTNSVGKQKIADLITCAGAVEYIVHSCPVLVAKHDLPPQSIHRLDQIRTGLVDKSQLM